MEILEMLVDVVIPWPLTVSEEVPRATQPGVWPPGPHETFDGVGAASIARSDRGRVSRLKNRP
jgi:hypothetical protein